MDRTAFICAAKMDGDRDITARGHRARSNGDDERVCFASWDIRDSSASELEGPADDEDEDEDEDEVVMVRGGDDDA